MRINKFLAEHGIASRRGADEMIAAGRVTINGVTATLGVNVEEDDVVMVDDLPVEESEKKEEYYIMNKPKGVICTVSDDRGRKTVMDLLPPEMQIGRVFPVGRLDYATEGLLLLTNDGDLAFKLTHPRSEIPKTYMVKIEGTLTEQDLNPIRSGVELDGVLTKKCKAHIVETHKEYTKVHITIKEGRNRQVRRMFEAIGKNVEFLKRISIGQLKLSGLDRGEIRPLTEMEIAYLKGL
jgi:23S rRNA pseudouridine2605 synthase